jgi:hypothetical protein
MPMPAAHLAGNIALEHTATENQANKSYGVAEK